VHFVEHSPQKSWIELIWLIGGNHQDTFKLFQLIEQNGLDGVLGLLPSFRSVASLLKYAISFIEQQYGEIGAVSYF
jgi:hypothetical protein